MTSQIRKGGGVSFYELYFQPNFDMYNKW